MSDGRRDMWGRGKIPTSADHRRKRRDELVRWFMEQDLRGYSLDALTAAYDTLVNDTGEPEPRS